MGIGVVVATGVSSEGVSEGVGVAGPVGVTAGVAATGVLGGIT